MLSVTIDPEVKRDYEAIENAISTAAKYGLLSEMMYHALYNMRNADTTLPEALDMAMREWDI